MEKDEERKRGWKSRKKQRTCVGEHKLQQRNIEQKCHEIWCFYLLE
jgi:hypothetical protein